MTTKSQRKDLPAFDRVAIFAEVDASNRRFEEYTPEQRRAFSQQLKCLRTGMHEARRARH